MKESLLRFLRVPPEPEPPAGSPESIRIFRAAPNFYYWVLFQWLLLQLITAAGLAAFFFALAQGSPKFPPLVRSIVFGAEAFTLFVFLLQLPFGFWKQRLDYEMRWYIVTDRSLRIRAGIWSVREITMTFANLQKFDVQQGPLQGLLRIADVSVTSAGGGSGGGGQHGKGPGQSDAHTAKFAGVANATAIRDLIIERVRQYKDAGLGDPDDHHEAVEGQSSSVHDAAREVLAEARQIRLATSGRNP